MIYRIEWTDANGEIHLMPYPYTSKAEAEWVANGFENRTKLSHRVVEQPDKEKD